MKLLKRQSKKSTHFDFVIFVETLSPWPTSYGSLTVQWGRGKRSGQTKRAWPDNNTPSAVASYVFGDTIIVPATMYQSDDQGYQSKQLSLYVTQVDEKGKEVSVLGGLEIDLADFVNLKGRVRHAFTVECSSTIWGMTGARPTLTITLGVAKNGDRAAELAATMSDMSLTDDLPANLSSDEEHQGSTSMPSSSRSWNDLHPTGQTDANPNIPFVLPVPLGGRTALDAMSSAARPGFSERVDPSPLPVGQEPQYDSDGFLLDEDEALVAGQLEKEEKQATEGVVKRNLEIQLSNADGQTEGVASEEVNTQQSAAFTRRFSRGDGAAAAAILGSRGWSRQLQAEEDNDIPEGQGNGDAGAIEAARAASTLSVLSVGSKEAGAGTPWVSGLAGGVNVSAASQTREIQVAAALEAAVYLAGAGWANSSPHRPPKLEALQAPARRLARTIIILGPEEGTAFASNAIAAIRASVTASLDDPHRILLWWANVVTLRWSFWALSSGVNGRKSRVTPTSGENFDWLATTLGPKLLLLEKKLFSDLVNLLWRGVLVPTAEESVSRASGRVFGTPLSRTVSNSSVSLGRSQGFDGDGGPDGPDGRDTGAGSHWIRGLRAVDVALNPHGRPPAAPRHLMSVLRRQLLLALLGRLDGRLVGGVLEDEEPSPRSPESMDPELLPFCKGALTFSKAVEMKMAAGRLAVWAADAGVREGPSPLGGSEVRLFPRLRAAADLLMMPKGALADAEIRRTVAAALPPSSIASLLQRYRAEDPASDASSPGLIKQLRAEAAAALESEGLKDNNLEYYDLPSDQTLLNEGLIQPLSLEMGADSDDELSALEETTRLDDGSKEGRRYEMLRELWKAVRM